MNWVIQKFKSFSPKPLVPSPASGTKNPAQAGLCALRYLQELLCWNNANGTTFVRTFYCEVHRAVFKSKQGVVAAHADVCTAMELGATLTNNDIASVNCLTAEHFHAEVFWIGIAAVA